MRGPRRQLAIVTLAVVALGGCGGEPRPIPRGQADGLLADLEEAKRRVDAGACGDVEKGTFVRLDRRVERLPDDIDSDVEQALRDGVGHLKDVAEEECAANRPAQTTTTAPTTVPSTTTRPAPVTSTTAPTDAPKGKGKGGNEDEQAPTNTEPPPPKDPDPPSDNPGGGAPSQDGDEG